MFSAADVESSFDRATRERGVGYRASKRILKLDVDSARSRIFARVRGSRPEPYDVVVGVGERQASRVTSVCSCPVGFNCKHGAAVAMEALASFASAQSTQVRDAADGAVDSWMERLASYEPSSASRPGTQVRYALKVREIYYVPRLEIDAYAATVQRGGAVTAVRSLDIANLATLGGKYVTQLDRTIARLAAASAASRSSIAAPAPAILGTLLDLAIESGRLHWESVETPPLTLAPIERARLVWRIGADGRQRPALDGVPSAVLVAARPVWYVDPVAHRAGPVELALASELAAIAVSAPALTERQAARVQSVWRRVVEPSAAPAPATPGDANTIDDEPVVELRLDEAHGFAYAQLRFAYGDRRVVAQDGGEFVAEPGSNAKRRRRRRDVESRAQERLLDLGLMLVGWPWNQQDERLAGSFRFAHGDDARWARVLHVELDRMRAMGWHVDVADRFPVAVAAEGIEWDARIESTENRWFDLELGVSVAGERISLLPVLLEAMRSGALESGASAEPVYARLPRSGKFVALEAERLNRILATLVELFETNPLDGEGRLRLPRARAAVLDGVERAVGMTWNGASELHALYERLRAVDAGAEAELPPEFSGELRPYQRRGVAWLGALRECGFGAVLADDMGLGKTVQLLAHAAAERAAARLTKPVLIVAPTSVVPNWLAEIARFTPHLRVLALHGADREAKFASVGECDIVVTTYALLQRDAEMLLAQDWSLAVLDEAQAIKNPRSKSAQTARRLHAGQRIALTGTPIENQLEELWSIFAFAVPELLGERSSFARTYRTPIEKRGDPLRREALAARVRPFLLRRTKELVAADLPPKSEIVQRVELDGPQRDLYETIRLAMHRRVRDEVSRRGMERSRIVVLDALLKLRQVCCDPRLLGTAARGEHGSAKMDALFDMLPDLLDDGRRILLFSQFTSMLDLIVPELKKRKMPFVELRGSTRDRATPVARFQGGEVPLFLISLKAGGTGLNLTAADTVIHYDPWWNPAVERQATDRAHRIGQDHPVFVYKLLTVGTVEERIAAMQERKAELADSLFAETANATGFALRQEDIDDLFAP